MTRITSLLTSAALALAVLGVAGEARSQAPEGMPWFFQTVPDNAMQGAWDAHRAILGPNTVLSQKDKYLMVLAVSAQIPCGYCIIAGKENARKAGATEEEIREAIAVAALTRFWSAVLQGNETDMERFRAHFGSPTN